jgi:3-oxoadipate enol-lactonase
VTRAALEGVELYYERAGTGPRLLLISGTGGDLRSTPRVFDAPWAQDFAIAAYDQRGLGQSSVPPGPYAMADYADDAAALLDVLAWEDALVMGISFGGMVAQEIALGAGDRVTRLVLACTSSGGEGGASYPLHEVYGADVDTRSDQMVELLDTRCAHDSQLRAGLLAWMTAGPRPAEVPPGLRRQLEARRHHDTWARLPGLTIPTLVAAGRYDGIAPLANSEALARQIPGARLQVFEGGHAFFAQDPSAWDAMAEFLLAS